MKNFYDALCSYRLICHHCTRHQFRASGGPHPRHLARSRAAADRKNFVRRSLVALAALPGHSKMRRARRPPLSSGETRCPASSTPRATPHHLPRRSPSPLCPAAGLPPVRLPGLSRAPVPACTPPSGTLPRWRRRRLHVPLALSRHPATARTTPDGTATTRERARQGADGARHSFFLPWNQVDLIFGKSGQPFFGSLYFELGPF